MLQTLNLYGVDVNYISVIRRKKGRKEEGKKEKEIQSKINGWFLIINHGSQNAVGEYIQVLKEKDSQAWILC